MKFKIIHSVVLSAVMSLLLVGAAHAAGSASLSLSPSAGSYDKDTNFSVGVYENGDNVNVVQIKLNYDSSKLSCTGVSGTSAFPTSIDTSCSGGVVTISRYTMTPVSGSTKIATIAFKALVGSGSSAVTFNPSSILANGGNNVWNGTTTGGTYSFTTPAVVTPPATTTPTPTNTTPSSTPTPSSTTQTAKPTTTSTAKSANAQTENTISPAISSASTASKPAVAKTLAATDATPVTYSNIAGRTALASSFFIVIGALIAIYWPKLRTLSKN